MIRWIDVRLATLVSEDGVSASRMAAHQDLPSAIMGAWLQARIHTKCSALIVR